ncbi:hypothetical protein EV426DRAFT_572907 [Tirmania nivea]|nr:hypothetical protein EV426DRAFT_572907 [Tirmania nivea]
MDGSRDMDENMRTHMLEVSTEASSETGNLMGLMNQRYAEVIVSPVVARKMLSEVSSSDTSYGLPSSWSIALLREKAILNWNAASRYVGLYPHSADPPIQITQIVTEYPQSSNGKSTTTINSVLLARPARSPASSYHHHHHHHHRSLRGLHTTLKLAGSFVILVLQAVKTFGQIILTALSRVPLIGRIYRKMVPARYRTGLHTNPKTINPSKDLGTPTLRIMEYNPPTQEDDFNLFKDFLNMEQFEDGIDNSTISTTLPQPVPTDPTSNFPNHVYHAYMSEQLEHLYIDPNQYLTLVDSHYHPTYIPILFEQFGAPLSVTENHYTPPPATSSQYDSAVESDWQGLVNFSGSSTPSSEPTDFDNMDIYAGTSPGLSLPASQNISPQSEGLETPTFTPSYSPVSVVSTPQQLPSPRKYTCEQESCGHKEFDRPCDLNKHLKTHNKHLECDFEPSGGCQMKFSTEKDRKRHRETVHEKKKPYVCHICVKEGAEGKEGRFSRKDNLRVHRKKVHGVE